MNSYFNVGLLQDYSQGTATADHLVEKFKLTNVWDSETDHSCTDMLNETFYRDFLLQRSNPLSYLREGMNARVAIELRKSSVLTMDKDFFEGHLESWTWEEIKQYRSVQLEPHLMDYEDHDWQYYYAARISLPDSKFTDFQIVFEECFADGDPNKPDDLWSVIRRKTEAMYFPKDFKFFR